LRALGDLCAVTQADRGGAGGAVRDLRTMVRMGPRGEWEPPLGRTSTVTGDGADELWEAIERHHEYGTRSGELQRRRRLRIVAEVQAMVAERLGRRAAALLAAREEGLAADLGERRIDPYRAAAILLAEVAAPAADKETSDA